jgi:hypothetical protein
MRKLLQFGADKFTSYEPTDMLKADNVLAELLQQFMGTYSSLVSVLVDGDTAQALKNYLAALPFQLRYRSALLLVRDLLEKQTRIEKLEYAELLLQSLLGPLVRDQKDGGIISGTGGMFLITNFS